MIQEPYGPWMVSSEDDTVKRFPKTLAGAKSIVRAAARRGVTLTIYERTRNVPGLGPIYYKHNPSHRA